MITSQNRCPSSDQTPGFLSQPGISCADLKVYYHDHLAIDSLSGAFQPGTMTAVIGPNGGGKTTLLNVIAGFIKPSSGILSLGGFTKNDLAYLPQNSNIDRSFPLRVCDVVAMGLYPEIGFYRGAPRNSCQKVLSALESVGLQDCLKRPLHALSGGQFQRVLFARIALQNAPVLLLDEPFAAIDTPTMELLARLLTHWQAKGKTIIAVLHDLDIVREFFPQTLVLARRGIAWDLTENALTLETIRQAKQLAYSWDIKSSGCMERGS